MTSSQSSRAHRSDMQICHFFLLHVHVDLLYRSVLEATTTTNHWKPCRQCAVTVLPQPQIFLGCDDLPIKLALGKKNHPGHAHVKPNNSLFRTCSEPLAPGNWTIPKLKKQMADNSQRRHLSLLHLLATMIPTNFIFFIIVIFLSI
jgi:hypothetical protein